MRRPHPAAWALALAATTLACDDFLQATEPGERTEPGDPAQAQSALVAGNYYQATNHFRGLGPEYLPGNGSDLATVDGQVLLLHVPMGVGGTRIYQMDPLTKTFADATAGLLPSKWGILEGYADGAFVDLNADGFKDILLIRDNSSWHTTGFLYDPANHMYRLLPFDRDLDFSGERAGEVATFFGTADISSHARRIIVADLDGDGDDDLFIGRRFANYIFENLSDHQAAWTYLSPNAAHFAPHLLDTIVRHPNAPDENQVQLTQVAVAYTPAAGGPKRILAADSICTGSYCGASLSPDLYVHDYGLRPNACAPSNGICEVGEVGQAGNDDCNFIKPEGPCPNTGCAPNNNFCEAGETGQLGNRDCAGVRAPVSCTFGDPLRRDVNASATAVAALDRDRDGLTDFLVLGGPPDTAREAEVVSCFRNPAQPQCTVANYPYLDKLEIRGAAGPSYAATAPAPAPLNNRWAVYDDVVATTSLDADAGPELATFSPRTRQAIGSATATAVGVLDVAANGALESPSCGTMLVGDNDSDAVRFMPFDLDQDGRMDFSLLGGFSARTYWGNGNGLAAGRGCLALDLRMPLTSRNLTQPVLADLDRDGDLDLMSQAWTDSGLDPSDRMFLRNDGGSFTDVTATTIGNLPKFYGGTTVAFDIDNDGDNDLVMATDGPMQVFRNDLAAGWTDISRAVLPPWYTTGGNIYNAANPFPACDPVPPQNLDDDPRNDVLYRRCRPGALVVGDFDGNKGLDLAFISRKGVNDVLFNNFDGGNIMRCDGAQAWCSRTGFLSARSDLLIRTVLPTTTVTGMGSENRSHTALAIDLNRVGQVDLVVLGAPGAGYDNRIRAYDRAFVNGISAPFPHAIACRDAGNCGAGELCVSYGNPFPDAKTCLKDGTERITNGWFTPQPDAAGVPAIPTRDAGPVVDRFGGLACAASGDLNADGRPDFVVATTANEYNLDTTRDAVFLPDGSYGPACTLGQGSTADLTDCDVVYECKPWKCQGSNPEGDSRWTNPLPETDPRCCVAIPVVKDTQVGTELLGRYTKSATCAAARGSLEYCDVKGYQGIATYGAANTPARAEAAIFVYINRGDNTFTKYQDPIALPAGAGKDSLYKSCNIADLNGDGRRDLFVTGYLMGDMPDAVKAHLPTPAGLGTKIRRYAYTQPSRIWLNPGWDKLGIKTPGNTPLTVGPFPMRSDKVYGSVVGDVDGDADLEIITSGPGISLFDRK